MDTHFDDLTLFAIHFSTQLLFVWSHWVKSVLRTNEQIKYELDFEYVAIYCLLLAFCTWNMSWKHKILMIFEMAWEREPFCLFLKKKAKKNFFLGRNGICVLFLIFFFQFVWFSVVFCVFWLVGRWNFFFRNNKFVTKTHPFKLDKHTICGWNTFWNRFYSGYFDLQLHWYPQR